ncbi:MAG: aminomethyl-transferring glycine dehydrogenase subunit GcvPA [Chloroflexi bacterium]|nr:aminomethyl-transferring glycine dehydrogenase subunit GcvPA [Chloroflexota bacterium]
MGAVAEPTRAHPFIPNSAPASRAQMLAALNIDSVDELYAAVPAAFRLTGPLDLPPPLVDEVSLRRHVEGLLARNTHTGQVLSFLGGGCYGGHVPAVVDEITRRAEFVTAYGGGPYGDHGKYQAIFEFQSLIGELVGMPAVSAPTYDGITATTSALLMAARLTGRSRLLVPETMNPDGLAHLRMFAKPWATIEAIAHDSVTGGLDLDVLGAALGAGGAAAVLIEMPSYLGFLEERAPEIAGVAHAAGALVVVSVDPSTLGILAPPVAYGANIVTGDAQSLGNHQLFGGGQCGFIAHRDEEPYVRENPAIKVSAVPSRDGTQTGFAWALLEATSYDLRGESRDFTGTSQWLWGIGAAVYLSLLGPSGLRELGEAIASRCAYAMERLAAVPGVRLPFAGRPHMREFVVDVGGSGHGAASVLSALRERGIFAGISLSSSVPWLGESLLVAVNENHTQADIDRLAAELADVLR